MGSVFTDLQNKLDGSPILFVKLDLTNNTTKHQDLAGDREPEQDHDKRTGGTVDGTDCAGAEIPDDERLGDNEGERRNKGTRPQIPPLELDVGEHLVDQCEGEGDQEPGQKKICDLPDELGTRQTADERRDARTDGNTTSSTRRRSSASSVAANAADRL